MRCLLPRWLVSPCNPYEYLRFVRETLRPRLIHFQTTLYALLKQVYSPANGMPFVGLVWRKWLGEYDTWLLLKKYAETWLNHSRHRLT